MSAPNQFRHAADIDHPQEFRDGQWQRFEPAPAVERILSGRVHRLRPGLTFTPYANPTACNARCAFCSEELLRVDGDRLSAKTVITDYDRYFEGLDEIWTELAGFPMGLSLSGLEATSEPIWLRRLLKLVDKHTDLLPSKVLYTNGSGLYSSDELIDELAHCAFDRVELSRCHFDEHTNQRIMRFAPLLPIRRAEAFERLIARLHGRVKVKLSCILNRQGVQSMEDVDAYLDRAIALGVDHVVFRELSALGAVYEDSRTHRWIDNNRAPVRALMDELWPEEESPRSGWRFVGATSGYYYYNEVYEHRGTRVVFEASSYVAHQNAQQSGILQKLVYHSTGELCGDWVPNAERVGQYPSRPSNAGRSIGERPCSSDERP